MSGLVFYLYNEVFGPIISALADNTGDNFGTYEFGPVMFFVTALVFFFLVFLLLYLLYKFVRWFF